MVELDGLGGGGWIVQRLGGGWMSSWSSRWDFLYGFQLQGFNGGGGLA